MGLTARRVAADGPKEGLYCRVLQSRKVDNRHGLAGAVLQTPQSLINELIN